MTRNTGGITGQVNGRINRNTRKLDLRWLDKRCKRARVRRSDIVAATGGSWEGTCEVDARFAPDWIAAGVRELEHLLAVEARMDVATPSQPAHQHDPKGE